MKCSVSIGPCAGQNWATCSHYMLRWRNIWKTKLKLMLALFAQFSLQFFLVNFRLSTLPRRGSSAVNSSYKGEVKKTYFLSTFFGLAFYPPPLWADAFFKSICPSVCQSVCLFVCPSVTFEVPFKCLFAPTSQSWMSNIF